MGVWVGICGGIFIRIYPRLLGRPAVCLQGFNGNHSTFLRSRRLRHPWMETRAVQRFSRTASDGFQKRETFLVISLSLLLNFQAVWTAFCCVDTCSLTWTEPSSTLTPSSPTEPQVKQRSPFAPDSFWPSDALRSETRAFVAMAAVVGNVKKV